MAEPQLITKAADHSAVYEAANGKYVEFCAKARGECRKLCQKAKKEYEAALDTHEIMGLAKDAAETVREDTMVMLPVGNWDICVGFEKLERRQPRRYKSRSSANVLAEGTASEEHPGQFAYRLRPGNWTAEVRADGKALIKKKRIAKIAEAATILHLFVLYCAGAAAKVTAALSAKTVPEMQATTSTVLAVEAEETVEMRRPTTTIFETTQTKAEGGPRKRTKTNARKAKPEDAAPSSDSLANMETSFDTKDATIARAKATPRAMPKVAEAKSESEIKPKITPKAVAEIKSESEIKPEITPKAVAETKPEPKISPKAATETKPEPKTSPKAAETKSEPKIIPKAATEAKPEPKISPKAAETKPEPKISPKAAETKPETKTASKAAAETKPETKTASKAVAEAKPEPKTTPKAVAEAKSDPKISPKAVVETKPEPKTASKAAEPKTTPKAVAEAKPEPKISPKAVVETKPERESTPKAAETKPEPKATSKATPKTKSEPKATPEAQFEATLGAKIEHSAKREKPPQNRHIYSKNNYGDSDGDNNFSYIDSESDIDIESDIDSDSNSEVAELWAEIDEACMPEEVEISRRKARSAGRQEENKLISTIDVGRGAGSQKEFGSARCQHPPTKEGEGKEAEEAARQKTETTTFSPSGLPAKTHTHHTENDSIRVTGAVSTAPRRAQAGHKKNKNSNRSRRSGHHGKHHGKR